MAGRAVFAQLGQTAFGPSLPSSVPAATLCEIEADWRNEVTPKASLSVGSIVFGRQNVGTTSNYNSRSGN
jgi:hypothetical protein